MSTKANTKANTRTDRPNRIAGATRDWSQVVADRCAPAPTPTPKPRPMRWCVCPFVRVAGTWAECGLDDVCAMDRRG